MEVEMRAIIYAIVIAHLVSMVGCGQGAKKKTFILTPIKSEANFRSMAPDEQKNVVQQNLISLVDECRPILTHFEDDAKKGSRIAFILSMSGLVAGAVVAPALATASASANAAWIAGLAGYAGATNTAGQALMTSGMSGTYAARDRNNIVLRIRDQLDIVFSIDKSEQEKLNAITRAKAECAIYLISIPSIDVNTDDK